MFFRWSRTGSTWPWWWIVCSCGSSWSCVWWAPWAYFSSLSSRIPSLPFSSPAQTCLVYDEQQAICTWGLLSTRRHCISIVIPRRQATTTHFKVFSEPEYKAAAFKMHALAQIVAERVKNRLRMTDLGWMYTRMCSRRRDEDHVSAARCLSACLGFIFHRNVEKRNLTCDWCVNNKGKRVFPLCVRRYMKDQVLKLSEACQSAYLIYFLW